MIKVRDLTCIPFSEDDYLVISCDSAGGIGEKKHDAVNIDPEIVGYYTARVAIVEFLAYGIKPLGLVDTLAVEMEPTGKKILNGIKRACNEAEIEVLSGSTEENMKTLQTAMGVNVYGKAKLDQIDKKYFGRRYIYCFGKPLVGDEVRDNPDLIISIREVKELRGEHYTREIIPTGSKGIAHDLENEFDKVNILIQENPEIDMRKSAGPACCALVSVDANFVGEFESKYGHKSFLIGMCLS